MGYNEKQYKEIIERLENENTRLSSLVAQYEEIIKSHGLMLNEIIEQTSTRTNDMKLKIFMDYFKGRQDCYAIRYDKEGKSGYTPRYKSEYRYISNKNRKGVSKDELYEPLTREVVATHLKGEETVGLYPMLDDQKTYLLAIDFDKQTYKRDVTAFCKVAVTEGFSPLIELSRSGKGAHVWFFFETKVLAKEARTLGKVLLSKTMLEQRSLSLDSYDRMFPAQDTIDDDQIGNLIALPLNGKSGQKGTTIFLDSSLTPFDDQYGQLLKVRKIKPGVLTAYLEENKFFQTLDNVSNKTKSLDIRPLDFLGKLVITIKNEIQIPKSVLTPRSEQFFMRISSVLNPDYYKKKAMRYSTYLTPRIIETCKNDRDTLYLPKGLLSKIAEVLNEANVDYSIIDERQSKTINSPISMRVDLYENQKTLFKETIKTNQGIIVAPTGFGKTVLGIKLATHYEMNTLILTHRVNICKQWKNQLVDLTNVTEVGQCYSGKCNLGNSIDIATFQSLLNNQSMERYKDHYGLILIDEVHHLAAYSFEKVIRSFSAKHVYGLTATPKRSDGLEVITEMLIGGIIAEGTSLTGSLQKDLYIRFVSTHFLFEDDLHKMTHTIMHDETRNTLIIDDILENYQNGKKILVLTERVEHTRILKEKLSLKVHHLFTVHGKLTYKERNTVFEEMMNIEEPFVILATGKYIGEGFDDNRLNTLLITMPFKWKGTLEQYVGRLNRQKPDKNQIAVYDYVDIESRVYSNMFLKRQKGYKKLGFSLVNEFDSKQYFYSEDEYQEKLTGDLSNASDTVFFMIRNSHPGKITKLIKQSKREVKEIKHETNMIIIDSYIIWYGSINPFVYSAKKQDSIMRIENRLLASKILQTQKALF